MASEWQQRRLRFALLLVFGALSAAGPLTAEIATDGSMGPAGVLSGPNYEIGSHLGTLRGGNLFHSFDRFSIGRGETAHFTGPGSVRNVISRVTGGEVSRIHGTLRSDITGANVFLINPSGVIFGAGARVDVSGALVVSTADELRFTDGGVFGVATPGSTVLTTAAPSAFGFLGGNRGAVIVQHSALEGAGDKAVTIASGDVQIRGGAIASSGGSIDLIAVGDAGTVRLTPTAAVAAGTTGTGNVAIRSGGTVAVEGAGSRIAIRGGRIVIDSATVDATDAYGGGITLEGNALTLRHGGLAAVRAVNDVGGHLRVRAKDVLVDGTTSVAPTGFMSHTESAGDGGNIQVVADQVRLLNGGQMASTTVGDGAGGDVSVQARRFLSRGQNLIDVPAGILTASEGDEAWGDSGGIRVVTDEGLLAEHGVIGTSTVSYGLGGSILIEGHAFTIRENALVQVNTSGSAPGGAIRFRLDGQLSIIGPGIAGPPLPLTQGTGIHTDTGPFTPILFLIDNTGAIDIRAGSIQITNGGGISITTTGLNGLGDLRIAAETIRVTGSGSGLFVNSDSAYLSTGDPEQAFTGDAGSILIEAGRVDLLDQAVIRASTNGTGDGGNIRIRSRELHIDGRGAAPVGETLISAGTELPIFPTHPHIRGGDAGNIRLEIGEILSIRNGGAISVFTVGAGNAGDMIIRAGRLEMRNPVVTDFGPGSFVPATLSATTEDVLDGAGRAGAIHVTAEDIFIGSGSRITAGTTGPGLGGVVHLSSRGDLVIDSEGGYDRPTIDVSYGSVSGQGESGNLILWAANDLIVRDASITATAVSGNGGYVAIGTTRPDAPYRVKRQKLRPQRLMIEDSTIEAQSAEGDGGWILLHGRDLVSVRRGQLTASAKGRGGRIDIDPEVVVLDGVEVFARSEQDEGGDISVRGGTYLRSPEPAFDVTSEVGLDGSVSEATQLDLSGMLLPLMVTLEDELAQLFEQCTVKLGQGISSFIVVGRGGLPTEPGLWLPAYAVPATEPGPAGAVP